MKSRMEKYYENENGSENNRSDKNKNLYSQIYNVNNYQPDSNVTVLANTTEIDLSKINELVNNREDYQRRKQYKRILEKDDDILASEPASPKQDPVYDINEMLKNAKNEMVVKEEDKYKKLDDTEYNILKGLNLDELTTENIKTTSQTTSPQAEKELRELIHTITTKKLVDDDLLAELKGSDDTEIVSKPNIIDEIKKDPDFFTNSLTFSKKDFELNNEKDKKLKKKLGILGKLFIFLLVTIIAVIILFLINNFLNIDITPW